MAKSLFEIRIIFLLDDFLNFYNELYFYYIDFIENPKNEDIKELKILNEMINKSDKLNDEQKKITQKLINDIYIYSFKKDKKSSVIEDTSDEDSEIIRDIIEGKIQLPNTRIEKMNFVVNYNKFKYPIDYSKIFTLDKNGSSVFEQAYGIRFDGKYYYLDIYLPDTITFLDNNRYVLKKAYERGETLYTNNGKYDMIPYPNIIEHLSFKTRASRNAIKFSFRFSKKGKMIDYDINPVYIRVGKHIEESKAKGIIKSGKDDDGYILLLKELIKLYNNNGFKNHKMLSSKKVMDLIAFPSILLNHFVSDKCDRLIFFDGNNYISTPSYYAPISTPMRKIVSDINLAIFLNHIGYFKISNDDFSYYVDHKEEIIDHLNEKRKLACITKKYPYFFK